MDQENISQDSIELLHECDKGIQMGLSAMPQVADKISDDQFRSVVEKSRNTPENLKDKIQFVDYPHLTLPTRELVEHPVVVG